MKVRISNCRLAFISLFKPTNVNGEGEPRYGAQLIIDPDSPDVAKLDEAMLAVATEKWKGRTGPIYADMASKDRLCFRHGPKLNSSGEPYDGFEGKFYLSAGARVTQRPLVIDRNRAPLTEEDGVIYGGCYADASVELWAQDNQFGKRINATLKGVQFRADGDAFTGSAPASANDFEDLSNLGSAAVDDLM